MITFNKFFLKHFIFLKFRFLFFSNNFVIYCNLYNKLQVQKNLLNLKYDLLSKNCVNMVLNVSTFNKIFVKNHFAFLGGQLLLIFCNEDLTFLYFMEKAIILDIEFFSFKKNFSDKISFNLLQKLKTTYNSNYINIYLQIIIKKLLIYLSFFIIIIINIIKNVK